MVLADFKVAGRFGDFKVVEISRAVVALLPEPQEAGTGKSGFRQVDSI
jgi:hypothetical protein